MDNQVEQWRAIEDFPEYEVSSWGRVRSNKFGGERILRPSTSNPGGYRRVTLSKNDTQKTFKISRLLAESFIPNPEGLPDLDHIDRNVTNDRLENLRWVTSTQNNLNTRKYSNNTSGIKGISRNGKSWRVCLQINGRNHRKTFKDMHDAREYLRGLVDALDIAEHYYNPDI